MAGETSTGSLRQALPSIIGSARIVKEKKGLGTWRRTCEVHNQTPNTGLAWQEFALNQVTGADITETTNNQNFQTFSGSLLSSEPQMSQIIMKVTDRTYAKIAAVVKSKMGSLAQNAIERKKDEDYLALFSGFATTASPGNGNPLSHSSIASAKQNASSNTTEPTMAEVFTILHGFQIYDIQVELLAGIGTYTVPEGITAEIFRRGFAGSVAGSNVFEDGNIAIVSSNANGATHSREGVIAVQGMGIKHETDRDIYWGGGADVISIRDEYSFVERQSGTAGTTQVWAYLHASDATAPAA